MGTTSKRRISFLVSESHYFDHLAPIYLALPEDARGVFYVLRSPFPKIWGRLAPIKRWWRNLSLRHVIDGIVEKAKRGGIPTVRIEEGYGLDPESVIVVAGVQDNLYVREFVSEVAYLEHGVGQPYITNGAGDMNQAGGPGRDNISLRLCTTKRVAEAESRTYPNSRSVIVGAPKLDAFVEIKKTRSAPPVVAISFHWNNPLAPEATGAFPHYRDVLPQLTDAPYTVLGHSHPKREHARRMQRYYRQVGIQYVPEFDDIMRRADVYVCDNSSTLFEFAALDRPVVVLNAPWYRRDVNHGLRFWEYADIGVQVDSQDDLIDGIAEALDDNMARQARRREIVNELYPFLGHAAQHAANQLVEHFHS